MTSEPSHAIQDTDNLRIFTTDLNGRLITLQVNPDNIESLLEDGVGYDGSSVAGHARVDDSDKLLVPLRETYRTIPLVDDKVGFMVGRVDAEAGQRSAIDARGVLERVVAQAREEFGYEFLVGPEHEFFLLSGEAFGEDIHSDDAGYFHADPRDGGDAVRREIVEVLRGTGIQFEKMHHEVTASQHEINLGPLDPLAVADRTLLFTYVAKRVAARHGLHASFMPKPFNGQNRSALHMHLSIRGREGEPVFFEEGRVGKLSDPARWFIGGIIKYARETSIVMASTFNSYKAYIMNREAPMRRGWGLKNRSSMVRVPYSNSAKSKRIELRSPDPSGNIYLQLATYIGMGLQGIREQLDCGEPDKGSTYDSGDEMKLWDERYLPRSLYEALVEAEKSSFLPGLLGEQMYSQYMALKTAEWEGYRTHVTSREHRRSLST
ncbi:probable glutamine synthetase [Plesiocystis pacifica SIR-1]|uniref:Probable glutamine synthetase n=1 Tax=Plesiocystis pacifica SIR-1 TaxID=391625 RepID=A6GHX0_9BACT|nr:glutamine synthetase family protein [Plesiocystis pacifica]EDM74524.1 probable glutamine synthetase [Plesiocystis pacifica SIR-1]